MKVFGSGMQRDEADGKTRWDLIADGPMLRRYAERMTMGADKYGERNWLKANSDKELDRYKESAFRHFMQWFNGEDDEDHAAAIIFNLNGAEYVRQRLATKPVREVGEGSGEEPYVGADEEFEEYTSTLAARDCALCDIGSLHSVESGTNREDGYYPSTYDPDPDIYGTYPTDSSLD